MRTAFAPLVVSTLFLSCASPSAIERGPATDVTKAVAAAPSGWQDQPSTLWQRDFSGSERDNLPAPAGDLSRENIGHKANVLNVFERWTLNSSLTQGRGTTYAEITRECRGQIELDFALSGERWQQAKERSEYYSRLESLIESVGDRLVHDFGDKLKGAEKDQFIQALKAFAWQETRWQHYLRYKDWFFVILSGGSYNKLDDWTLTQIARSSFSASQLMNKKFFASKGYCSIGSSLYYGFMEYYFHYLEARESACNGANVMNQLVGAYNRYSSGFSACYNAFSSDPAYRKYQEGALGGFKKYYTAKPWLSGQKVSLNTQIISK
jgi:hypothetical protein